MPDKGERTTTDFMALLCRQLERQRPLSPAAGREFVERLSRVHADYSGQSLGPEWGAIFQAIHTGAYRFSCTF